MKRVNILIMSFLIILFGCESSEYMDFTDTQIPIENADARFSAVGGQKEFTVDFSDNYTVHSDQSWCKASINGKTITVNVEPNRTVSGRTALLTLQSGKRSSSIPLTQTSAVIALENYTYDVWTEKDTVYVQYECDFPVNIVPPSVDWIKGSANHEKKELMFVVEEEKTSPRTVTIRLYADGGNNTVLTMKEIHIRQNFLSYDDFIGPYTMYYSKYAYISIATSSIDVSLVVGARGTSYFLKGILTDDDAGNIVVYYNESTGSLSMSGCKIRTAQNANSPDLWWAPYQKGGSSYYVTPTNAYGMISVNHDISQRLKFSFDDDGMDPGYTTIGFILRKYIGTTNNGNVNGKDNQAMYFYPTFEKK